MARPKGTIKRPRCDIKICNVKAIAVNNHNGLRLCELHRNIYDLIGKEKFMQRFINIQKEEVK